MKNIVAVMLILALICICAASVFALVQGWQMLEASGVRMRLFENQTVSAEATEEKTLQVEGPLSLTVTNGFGFVTVKAVAGSVLRITAEKTAWGGSQADAEAALADLKVIVEQKGEKIGVRIEQPAEVRAFSIGPGSGSVNFTIEVPLETSVDLNATNGDLSLEGTSGEAKLKSSFGSVAVKNVTGLASMDTAGGIKAENLDAGTEAISLHSQYGEIDARGLKGGDISIYSGSGQMTLRDIQASQGLALQSQFGAIKLTGGQSGPMTVDSNNGSITIEGLRVRGEVKVTSQFGDISLNNVKAEAYMIESQNGRILVDGAAGRVSVASQFGEIKLLKAVNVTAKLTAVNGGITFEGSLGDGPHVFESEYGSINLTLPEESALDFDLKTEFGSITSEFAMTVKGKIEEKHWQGKINGGGPELTVHTNNGNITLTISQ
ncbi:MAG: DUF4097 family beta strand repeat-containing protein [Anaerolineales bacterium]|jgi:DUF4097 and DUF4098 domain-containing protein YvlB|nr:DUF4097 family beta strand repeat-containing protein [Anaerolineales bacterium]